MSAQALEALAQANEVRLAAAALRRSIGELPFEDGTRLVALLLEDHDPVAGAVPVSRLISSPQRIGARRVDRLLRYAGIMSGDRRVRDLSVRQVALLVALLRSVADREVTGL